MNRIVFCVLLLASSLAVQSGGCDRLNISPVPRCDGAKTKTELISAALESNQELSGAISSWAIESLRSDPEMQRSFKFPDPISGAQQTTTGVELAETLPATMGFLTLATGISGFLEALSEDGSNPEVQARFQADSRESERRMRAFTEDSNVKRVLSALEKAYERGKSRLRVTAIRPRRIDERLRLCECVAQISWEDEATVLLDDVRYTVQYTTENHLMVTYHGADD